MPHVRREAWLFLRGRLRPVKWTNTRGEPQVRLEVVVDDAAPVVWDGRGGRANVAPRDEDGE
jgi:hypothetical protein